MEIKIQELVKKIDSAAGRKSALTVRANGRYLGTLYCLENEAIILLALLSEGSECVHGATFALEVREK